MFDFIRRHIKLLQFVLVLLIFPSFVFFGIEGYSRFHEGGAAVPAAKVDGQQHHAGRMGRGLSRSSSSACGGRCRTSTRACSTRRR